MHTYTYYQWNFGKGIDNPVVKATKDQYKKMLSNSNRLAERIAILGEVVPGSLKEISEDAIIQDNPIRSYKF